MADDGGLQQNIFSLASALQEEHRKKFHFVRYEDLVNQPQQTLESIYEFLEIKKFKHSFEQLKWQPMINETDVFGIAEMHSVKPSLEPSNTDVSILSEYTRGKYKNALDFLAPVVRV